MKKSGFTLIELLVVIAIIALLASIILVSLNSARNKGKDTRVIADVQQTRTGLESGNSGSPTPYPDLQAAAGAGAQNAVAGILNVTGPDYTNLNTLANDATIQGGAINYIVNTDVSGNVTDYAVYGQLVTNPSTYYCSDSVGDTNVAASANTAITCP